MRNRIRCSQEIGIFLIINQTTNYDVYDYWVGLVKGGISLKIGPKFFIYLRTNFFYAIEFENYSDLGL